MRPTFADPAVLIRQPTLSSAPGPLPAVRGAVPDTVLDGGEIGRFSVRAASVRGDGHRFVGRTRQDAMAFGPADAGGSPALVACVADGLSSRPLSHLGAGLASRVLRDAIEPELATLADDAEAAAAAACAASVRVADALCERARADGAEPEAYATTLTAAVLTPDPDGARVALLRVGDSAALILGRDGWRPCFPEPGQGPAGEGPPARELPRDAACPETAVVRAATGEMLLLCTGGLAEPMRHADVRDALGGWWTEPGVPELAAFLWHVSFRARAFSDDRTALCVWIR
ncbi:protein phosphatase 2C domain-containing protein [Actinoplanes subtropicus]|uniref:protein phosphatase 2C domain-containing protein n=1 Tax=Actinoplanes subtropicus TaxID=543632 RepID=UPI0004C31C0E|nr:protein phosphatase 2C domain-containing protein [Actinoplanes subtropicus]